MSPKRPGVTRREFVATAGGAVAGALVSGPARSAAGSGRRRYAIVGTGIRGVGMWSIRCWTRSSPTSCA